MKKIIAILIFLNFMLMPVSFAELVMYNTQTKKFHSLSCSWARRCTVNCIKIERALAIKKGGIPCKVCGG